MRASHGLASAFDGHKLVSHAGLAAVLELAERASLSELIRQASTLPAANVAVKARTVIAGMLAEADSIDDLEVLRAGVTARLIEAVQVPSTVGTFRR